LAGDWVEAKKYIQGQEYWVKCQVIETRPRYNRALVAAWLRRCLFRHNPPHLPAT
jgi:hypothetical protein